MPGILFFIFASCEPLTWNNQSVTIQIGSVLHWRSGMWVWPYDTLILSSIASPTWQHIERGKRREPLPGFPLSFPWFRPIFLIFSSFSWIFYFYFLSRGRSAPLANAGNTTVVSTKLLLLVGKTHLLKASQVIRTHLLKASQVIRTHLLKASQVIRTEVIMWLEKFFKYRVYLFQLNNIRSFAKPLNSMFLNFSVLFSSLFSIRTPFM